MNHQEIEEKEIIERYVLHQLAADERLAFQEHFFSCDECFERAQMEARFIASARQASRSGVLASDEADKPLVPGRSMPAAFSRGFGGWLIPALAASLLLVVALTGLWALSVRRENQLLAARAAEQGGASERLRVLEEKVRELEAGQSALQQQKDSLNEEIGRLKEELTANERQHQTELAQLREPEINVPVRNIYPVGGAQRSGRTGEANRVRVPRGTKSFVVILSDFKSGYADYRLEIMDSSGRLVTVREGLKLDEAGDLSVMLNRALLTESKYTLKLFGQRQLIAEYVIVIE